MPGAVRVTETEGRCGRHGQGAGARQLLFNGGRVSVWEEEKVLEMVVMVVAQQCGCV